jgi:hypothetical protein
MVTLSSESFSKLNSFGMVFTILPFSKLTNGPNELECYITLGWKGLTGTKTLAYYDQ